MLSGGWASVYSAKFHPKENVVASAWGDGFIRLIDLSGKVIGEYRTPGSSSPAFCVDFSDDGRFLGAVFGNGTACAWECRRQSRYVACGRTKVPAVPGS